MTLPRVPKGSWRLTHEIVSETRAGDPIPNGQKFEFSINEINEIAALQARYPAPTFVHRTPSNTIYNCHGMTFASRRTWISDSQAVRKILADDGYVKITEKDALPGDVVIYVSDDGDVEHSGIVTREARSPEGPMICSKWGKYGEVIHSAHRSPYSVSLLEYYRVKE